MSELKFKVGDKVKVVNKRSEQFGKEGTIIDFDDYDFPFAIRFKNTLDFSYFKKDELELINDNEENKEMDNKYKFKVGDKVKILSDEGGIRKAGEEGVVLEVIEGSMTNIYVVDFNVADRDGDFDWRFYEGELELVKESASTNIDELCEKTQQTIANFTYTLTNPNQPLLDSFKELLNISEQLSEFNNKNNTKLRIIIE